MNIILLRESLPVVDAVVVDSVNRLAFYWLHLLLKLLSQLNCYYCYWVNTMMYVKNDAGDKVMIIFETFRFELTI